MGHTLHAIHGSHPCVAVERALQLTRQPYRVVEYPPLLHIPAMRLRFGHGAVPVLVLGSGEVLTGSRPILHRLAQLLPESGLLPADSAQRERVLAAERWGDEVLQALVRRLIWMGMKASPRAIDGYAAGSKLPLPRPLRTLITPAVVELERRHNRADEQTLRADCAALPGLLEEIDGLIDDGVIGGPVPNAADLQIGASLRLLETFADARPLLGLRPCWESARRTFPTFPGEGELPPGSLPIARPAPTALAPLAAA